jgi:hypothetical protein
VLVEMIREHVEQHGTGPDGWLFQTYRGGIYLPSTPWNVLQKARKVAFTEVQQASLLAHRPYDFRHAGVSWRLSAGTPPRWSPSGPGIPSKFCSGSTRTASTATTTAESARWTSPSAGGLTSPTAPACLRS